MRLSPSPCTAQPIDPNITSPFEYVSFDIPGPSTTNPSHLSNHKSDEAEHKNLPDTDTDMEDSTSIDAEMVKETLSSGFSPFPYGEQCGLMARTTFYTRRHPHALVTARDRATTHMDRARCEPASPPPLMPRRFSLATPSANIPSLTLRSCPARAGVLVWRATGTPRLPLFMQRIWDDGRRWKRLKDGDGCTERAGRFH